MITGKPGEYFDDGVVGGYFAKDGHLVVCYEYGLSDADIDRYAVEIQNGDGYYDSSGKYRSYERD